MRRAPGIAIAAAVLVLLALAGGYAVFWHVAAGRLRSGIGQLAQALRPHQVDLSWQRVRIGGFPLALRVEVTGAELHDRVPVAASVTRLPRLRASAAPWNFAVWHLAAPDGLTMSGGAAASPATASAQTATGTLLLPPQGGLSGWFNLERPHAEAGVALTAQHAALWLILPPHPPKTDQDAALGFAVDARELSVPGLPAPFHNPLDELAFGVTVRGPVPNLPPREAAAAWRNAGGSADVDHFTLRSGELTISGAGTFALDAQLQPEGAFSVAIEDYPVLLQALVADGRLSRDEAGLAGLALAFFARTGPDGKPEIKTSLRMQHGEMLLGPVAIGPAPHIKW